MTDSGIQLPRYKCHNEVGAAKIERIWFDGIESKILIELVGFRYATIELSQEFFNKHRPRPGGYFVQYDDGYQSFSPADAFESGYTLALEECDGQ